MWSSKGRTHWIIIFVYSSVLHPRIPQFARVQIFSFDGGESLDVIIC